MEPITICDVGPRDGLQIERRLLSPAIRAELGRRISAAGVPAIEIASFVDPARVPQMAESERVVALTEDLDARRTGLVLNRRGYERLTGTALEAVTITVNASDTFSRRNQNASAEQSLAEAIGIRDRAAAAGLATTVVVVTAFGCPFEGEISPRRVTDLIERVCAARATDVVLADTIGVGTPAQVGRLVAEVKPIAGRIGVHLHNTRNAGYANAYAAIDNGATILDASIGGIGGCPFAPAATGNIATEDLVEMLERDGIVTAIDVDALIETARWLEVQIGHPTESLLARAGRFS